MRVALVVAAVVVFVLAALGVHFGSFGELDLIASGLALATVATVVP